MKAVRLQAHGDADQLRYEDAPDPRPGADDVLIRIAAISLNPVDMLVRQGWMKERFALRFPAILGVDAAGTVLSVGANVTAFQAGDRVLGKFPINGRGTMAEQALALPAQLAKMPDGLSFEAAATLPMAGLTGRQAVDALNVAAGDRVLVTGALGAVGRVAVQYLKELGARPVAMVRAARLEEGRALTGEVFTPGDETVASFAGAVDTAGGDVAAMATRMVRDGGTVATVAAVVPFPGEVEADSRVSIRHVVNRDDSAMLGRIAGAAAAGNLMLPIAWTFDLAQASQASRLLESGRPDGKILLIP